MRNAGIDLLRLIAVVLVLGRHMPPVPSDENLIVQFIADAWRRGGWVGVDLFFVLSGFLVSGLLFKEYQKVGSINAKRFLIRRGFKIYPPFWVLVLATIFVNQYLSIEVSASQLVSEILFVQNYFPPVWNHTWSLAIEEHFYFLLVLLIVIMTSKRANRFPFKLEHLPRIFVCLACVCLVLRLLVGARVPYSHESHLFPTHLRVDSLFFGVILSYYKHFRPDVFTKIDKLPGLGKMLIGTVLLSPAFIWPIESTWWISSIGVLLFYLGSGLLLLAFLQKDFFTTPLLNTIAVLGSYSYSMYLWHMPVLVWGVSNFERTVTGALPWRIFMLIYCMGAIVVGIYLSKAIETPVLKFRNKWFASQVKAI